MSNFQPGSLIRFREREWVVLPSDDPNLVLLRPIGGSAREVCGVVKPLADLMAYESPPRAHRALLSSRCRRPRTFRITRRCGCWWKSARLLLRDGAAPFRSLGHLSVAAAALSVRALGDGAQAADTCVC